MKVYVEAANVDALNSSGKGLFMSRLTDSMRQKGALVSNDRNATYDVAIHVARLDARVSARKHVLRLDGVYHNLRQNYKQKNAGIKDSFYRADAVIYQSNHAKRLCDAFLGECQVINRVIYNGSDPEFYRQIPAASGLPQRHVIMAFAKWRPHKRLRDIIECYLLADIDDGVLLIAGDVSRCGIEQDEINRYFQIPSIRYLERLDQVTLASHIKRADLCLHLCWFDACPNSVVESICAGTPVVSNNVGGTPELMRIAGMASLVCFLDAPYNYDVVDLYNPPAIDRRKVVHRIKGCLEVPVTPCADLLDVRRVADQYLEFFEVLL